MVIYWFGFIEDLDNNRENGIIVCDDFPKDIEVCNPLKNSSEDEYQGGEIYLNKFEPF